MQALVATTRSELEAGLREDEGFARLQRLCGGVARDRACAKLLSDALYAAQARRMIPALADDRLGAVLLHGQLGDDAYVAQLQPWLGREHDDATRFAAGLLLMSVAGVLPHVLPASAYQDLAHRPDPEIDLILNNHAVAPAVDPQLTRAVAELAVDPATEPRLRQQAVLALGHEHSADELRAAIGALDDAGALDAIVARQFVGPALASCGAACVDAIGQLAADGRYPERLSAWIAVGLMRPDLRDVVRPRVELVTPALSSDERDEYRRWMAMN